MTPDPRVLQLIAEFKERMGWTDEPEETPPAEKPRLDSSEKWFTRSLDGFKPKGDA